MYRVNNNMPIKCYFLSLWLCIINGELWLSGLLKFSNITWCHFKLRELLSSVYGFHHANVKIYISCKYFRHLFISHDKGSTQFGQNSVLWWCNWSDHSRAQAWPMAGGSCVLPRLQGLLLDCANKIHRTLCLWMA